MTTDRPSSEVTSSYPMSTSAKYGPERLGKTMPLAACLPSARLTPARLGVNRSSSTTRITLSRVAPATGPVPRNARDTVAMDTPARRATS